MNDIKKGDVIEQRKMLEKGKIVYRGLKSLASAQESIPKVYEYFNFSGKPQMTVGYDEDNPGLFAIMLDEEAAVYTRAKVNWKVEDEISIMYLDTGGHEIVNLKEVEDPWVVIESAQPKFQSDVEHMSDEELRASIEELRSKRSIPPATTKKKTAVAKEPALSAEEKKTQAMLNKMSPEELLVLKRKMGLI